MSDTRQQAMSDTKEHFLAALASGDVDIEHKVSVNNTLSKGGTIDYKKDNEDIVVKSAKLSRKKDEYGGFYYVVKIVIE